MVLFMVITMSSTWLPTKRGQNWQSLIFLNVSLLTIRMLTSTSTEMSSVFINSSTKWWKGKWVIIPECKDSREIWKLSDLSSMWLITRCQFWVRSKWFVDLTDKLKPKGTLLWLSKNSFKMQEETAINRCNNKRKANNMLMDRMAIQFNSKINCNRTLVMNKATVPNNNDKIKELSANSQNLKNKWRKCPLTKFKIWR